MGRRTAGSRVGDRLNRNMEGEKERFEFFFAPSDDGPSSLVCEIQYIYQTRKKARHESHRRCGGRSRKGKFKSQTFQGVGRGTGHKALWRGLQQEKTPEMRQAARLSTPIPRSKRDRYSKRVCSKLSKTSAAFFSKKNAPSFFMQHCLLKFLPLTAPPPVRASCAAERRRRQKNATRSLGRNRGAPGASGPAHGATCSSEHR